MKALIYTALALAAAAGCTGRVEEQAPVHQFAYPAVPDSLVLPSDRAAYIACRFWENFDFGDSALLADTIFVEQCFADYAAVLGLVPDSVARMSVVRLLDEALGASDGAYRQIAHLADHYLYDAASPMSNERLYQPFVRYEARRPGGDTLTANGVLEMIAKNRPGSMAPDLTFTARDGARRRLLRPGSSAEILLFFHEPGCPRCAAAARALASSQSLAMQVREGRLRVVMLYPGRNYEAWLREARTLPSAWEAGIDADGLIDSLALFDIRATPTLYLLRPDGTVVYKDAPPEQILASVEER